MGRMKTFALSLAACGMLTGQTASRPIVQELVLANRILSNEEVVDAYGHVSVRDDRNPNHYSLARHVAAGLVTAAVIIEYDLDTNPVSGNRSDGYSERFI